MTNEHCIVEKANWECRGYKFVSRHFLFFDLGSPQNLNRIISEICS
jgi:hypothetical protein